MSPTRPVGSSRIPDRVAVVALERREPVDRLRDLLLERPPLRGAALALGLDLRELVPFHSQLVELLLQGAPCDAWIREQIGVLTLARLLQTSRTTLALNCASGFGRRPTRTAARGPAGRA